LIIAIATFFISLGFSIVNVSSLPVFVSQYLHATAWVGIILGVQTLFDTIARPFLGIIGDKIGRRYPVIIGPILSAITAAITIYIGIGVLFGLRIIDGIAAGALWTCVYAEAADLSAPEHRNTAMSMVTVAFLSALALGPLFGGLADAKFGHYFPMPVQASFMLTTIVFLIGSAIAFFIFRSIKVKDLALGEAKLWGFNLPDLTFTFQKFPMMIIIALTIFIGVGLIGPIAKLYAIERYSLNGVDFGIALAIGALALGVLVIPLARLGDWWGVKKSVFYGLILIFFGIWGLTYSPTIFLAMASVFLLGLGFVIALPAWLSLITEIAPRERRGEVLGIIGLGQGVGILIGSSLSGILFILPFNFPSLFLDQKNLPFFIAALLLSLSLIFTYFWVYRRKFVDFD
jgi:MFS family permease